MDSNELNVLVPEPVRVIAGGETVEVLPLTIGQIPAMARALRGVPFGSEGDVLDVLALVADHGDAIAEAVAIAVRRPRQWIDGLTADEFIQLTAAVIGVNAGFFTRSVLPAVSDMMTKLAGATLFSDSSHTDTAGPRS
ncbi:hypothetical protein [Methylocaldum sp.]|uniref:hypothetical protein n=1 Tax=Methylocaldum sp. TaxID=1969727 RepID=UPI002D5BAFBD|nr:hypothetical protein [Methylocaldum sp.]HYE35506.1 hypothetical protein [Methylocaldum sp.]